MPTPWTLPTLLILSLLACGAPASDTEGTDAASDVATDPGGERSAASARQEDRPATITDSISLEGTREPIRLELYRTPDDFPLPFSAYVPEEMAAEASSSEEEGGGSIHFYAEFGGARNELAFVHVFVYPPDTDLNSALAVVRGYKAGRGIPVSQGLEPLDEQGRTDRMPWAERAFRFEYQAGGEWYFGTIGLGQRDGRVFHVIRHYPAEYGDGFGPRAALITGSWQWGDGSAL